MKPRLIPQGLAAWAVLTSLTGCSALFMGSTQNITVTSEPSGGEILLNSVARDVTPAVIPVGRNQRLTVTVRKEGYYPSSLLLDQKFTLAGWLDILGSPLIIPMVGLTSPGRFRQSPEEVHMDLRPVGGGTGRVVYVDKNGKPVAAPAEESTTTGGDSGTQTAPARKRTRRSAR